MLIRLPGVESFNTLNLPDDFEERVKKSFGKFTQGTHKDYTQIDKLQYIDNLKRYYIRGLQSGREEVKKLIGEKVYEYLEEYGEMPDGSEILSLDFMEECYEKGSLHFNDNTYELRTSDNNKTLKVIAEIIKIVMNWEKE